MSPLRKRYRADERLIARGMKSGSLIVTGAALLLCSCHKAAPPQPSVEDKARAIITPTLTDPTSILLRNVHEGTDPTGAKGICGEVNAKNQFGGYAGFRMFVIDEKAESVRIAPADMTPDYTYVDLYWRFCPTPADRIAHEKMERESEAYLAKVHNEAGTAP
jgi:hypothetical protein